MPPLQVQSHVSTNRLVVPGRGEQRFVAVVGWPVPCYQRAHQEMGPGNVAIDSTLQQDVQAPKLASGRAPSHLFAGRFRAVHARDDFLRGCVDCEKLVP
jgi:hypothetical protein